MCCVLRDCTWAACFAQTRSPPCRVLRDRLCPGTEGAWGIAGRLNSMRGKKKNQQASVSSKHIAILQRILLYFIIHNIAEKIPSQHELFYFKSDLFRWAHYIWSTLNCSYPYFAINWYNSSKRLIASKFSVHWKCFLLQRKLEYEKHHLVGIFCVGNYYSMTCNQKKPWYLL